MTEITRADVQIAYLQFQEELRAAIKAAGADTAATIKVVEMPIATARLFVELLHDFDPDMPPRPICKILGPLVGDTMMNAKLKRLDEIADKLGPAVMLLLGQVNRRQA